MDPTLSAGVLATLRGQLVAGQLAPGDRLSLRTLALRLGVSMQPVRDAVARLVAERALEVTPKRAVQVPLMSASQFRELKNSLGGSSDAIVYSAFPMDTTALGGVSTALEKRFGRKLNVSIKEDPSLIGGIRVVVGDEVLDTSVKARLEQMKVALTA